MRYLFLFLICTVCLGQDRLRKLSLLSNSNQKPRTSIYQDVSHDFNSFYSKKTFDNSFFWLSVGALLANTNADHAFSHWYADSIRSEKLDRWSAEFKHFGNGEETLPILLGVSVLGYYAREWGIDGNGYMYDWGSKSLRTMFIGAPTLLVSQRVIGSGRHIDGDDSTWNPFNDANGVSGHAFMGAVPFLTAAHMTDDKIMKSAFYLGSTLCAWSRVNDDDHYLSQAVMGWGLAYVSSLAVFDKDSAIVFTPIIDGKRFGIYFSISF